MNTPRTRGVLLLSPYFGIFDLFEIFNPFMKINRVVITIIKTMIPITNRIIPREPPIVEKLENKYIASPLMIIADIDARTMINLSLALLSIVPPR